MTKEERIKFILNIIDWWEIEEGKELGEDKKRRLATMLEEKLQPHIGWGMRTKGGKNV